MRYYPACRPYGKVAEARLVSFQDCMFDASAVRAVLRSVLLLLWGLESKL